MFFLSPIILGQDAQETTINEGVVSIREIYQVFPVGKMGNTIYINNKKLFSKQNLILKDVIEVFEGQVVYGITDTGEPELEFIGKPEIKFRKVANGYYQITNESRQRKILRVNPADQIQILLPKSNTASGLVHNGESKAAFFHIYKGEMIQSDDGKSNYQYTFKIHIIRSTDDDITTLNEYVSDFSSRLKLKWIKTNLLQYELSNGVVKSIRID